MDNETREKIAIEAGKNHGLEHKPCEMCYEFTDRIIAIIDQAGYIKRPELTADGKQLLQVRITRKEFLSLPMRTRRRILAEQAEYAHDRETEGK